MTDQAPPPTLSAVPNQAPQAPAPTLYQQPQAPAQPQAPVAPAPVTPYTAPAPIQQAQPQTPQLQQPQAPAPQQHQQAPAPLFDQFTGQPLAPPAPPAPMFDPYTGQPLNQAPPQAPQPQAPQQPFSGYNEIQNQQSQTQQQADQVQALTQEIVFEKGFDDVIKNNSGLFSVDAQTMRAPYQKAGVTGQALNHALKCTAVQSFFADEKNLSVVHEQDQEFLKTNVIGKPDVSVDSAHAWAILENALHISARLKQNVDFRTNNAKFDSNDTPNATKFFDKIQARGDGRKRMEAKQ